MTLPNMSYYQLFCVSENKLYFLHLFIFLPYFLMLPMVDHHDCHKRENASFLLLFLKRKHWAEHSEMTHCAIRVTTFPKWYVSTADFFLCCWHSNSPGLNQISEYASPRSLQGILSRKFLFHLVNCKCTLLLIMYWCQFWSHLMVVH